jgi:hypothetical protein
MLKNDYCISNFEDLSREEISILHKIIDGTHRHDVADISTTRGHAYMLFENYEYGSRKNKNENPVIVFSNSPTGREEHIPRIMNS